MTSKISRNTGAQRVFTINYSYFNSAAVFEKMVLYIYILTSTNTPSILFQALSLVVLVVFGAMD